MLTFNFPVVFTISDTKCDGPAAFPFFILLIHSLTMPLFVKLERQQTVSIWDKLFLSHVQSLFSKACHDNLSKLFSYLNHWLSMHYYFLCSAR